MKIFSDETHPENWERFQLYARRVRSLRISPEDQLDRSVFIEIGCFRMSRRIIPNLTKLVLDLWSCARTEVHHDVGVYLPRFSLLFLHEGVEDLEISIPESGLDYPQHIGWRDTMTKITSVYKEVVARAPKIASLRLISNYRIGGVSGQEDNIVMLVHGLQSLEELSIPPRTLSPTLLSQLAKIPTMKSITIADAPAPFGSIHDINRVFSLTASEVFYRLRTLSITGSVENLRPLFSSSRFPELLNLGISKIKSALPGHLEEFLSSIAYTCPRLEVLELTRDDNVDSPHDHPMLLEGEDVLNAMSIQPLTRLHYMKTLIVDCYTPVDMTEEELVDWIMACPSLKTLHLVHKPSYLSVSKFTFDVLRKLASRQCKIESLALYIDASEDCCRSLAQGSRLQCLRNLEFGCSFVCSAAIAATYLAHYLPFKLNATHPATCVPVDAFRHEYRDRVNEWEHVQELLACITIVRKRDIVQIDKLENRVNELESKLLALQNRLHEIECRM